MLSDTVRAYLTLHRLNVLFYAGCFLLVGGWALLTKDERPWTSRSPAQRYLLTVTLLMLLARMIDSGPT